ncbi:MAG: (Fe-S)-binding protein [Thermoplasmata archaeon]
MDAETEMMVEVAEACAKCRCGCCKDQCPMYSEILEETMSPKGRNVVIRALVNGILEPDERTVRIAYSCLLCKRDELSCTAKLKNAEATEAFRRYLVKKGVPLLPEHALLAKSLENYGNPWQESKSARKRWAKEFQGRRVVPGRTETLFYVGCTFALDRTLQDSPRALARIMQRAGEDFGMLLEDEVCCGSTVKRIGHTDLFERLRKENERRIRDAGVKRIVTQCAGCYKTLKQDYPGLAKDFEIMHSTEYLARLVESGKLRPDAPGLKVTYHDPCHLGRHTEVYDPPRRILRSIKGLQLIEMENSREMSRCCGGGAGVKTAYPEISQKAATRRVIEAEATGAGLLVTACPFCVQTLSAAARAMGSPMEVVELSVLLDRLSAGG